MSPTDQSWLALNPASSSAYIVGEMVTAEPHNLKAGQLLQLASGSATFSQSDGPVTVVGGQFPPGSFFLVYPTGPTTFAFTWFPQTAVTQPYDLASLPGGMNNIVGSSTVDYVFSFYTPEAGQSFYLIPYETYAQSTGALPGCDIWVHSPLCRDRCLCGGDRPADSGQLPEGSKGTRRVRQ